TRLEAKQQELIKEIELRVARVGKEADAVLAAADLDKVRMEKEFELARLRQQEELERKETETKAELTLREAVYLVTNRQSGAEVELEASRQRIHNDMSPSHLQARLIEALPDVVEKLPKPDELRSISIGGAGSNDGQGLV